MRHNLQRLLTTSFHPPELEYLRTKPEFREAVAMMKTLDDFEHVAFLGNQLLSSADPLIRRDDSKITPRGMDSII